MSYRPHKRKRATRLDGKCVEVVGDNLQQAFHPERLPASISYTSRWSIVIPHPPDSFDQHKDQFLSEYCRRKELTNVRIVGTESANDSNQMNDAPPSTRVGSVVPNLESIDLKQCSGNEILGTGGFEALCEGCRQLRKVNLAGIMTLRDEQLACMHKLGSSLRSVDLGGSVCLSSSALATFLMRAGKNLQELDLSGCQVILSLIENCKSLTSLSLGYCEATHHAMAMLFRNLKKVTVLRLVRSFPSAEMEGKDVAYKRSRAMILLIARHMGENLLHLDITGCKEVKPDEVVYLLQHCPNLQYLNLKYCTSLPPEFLEQTVPAILPGLKTLERDRPRVDSVTLTKD
ncbi:hypothetical protein GUITHDRAFT_100490 [Guillardia theta CCMP2712]|uniref:Uncharacterized protein n=1 Tax=Guillardia theta (strain CCMP2712) TaxID=905079 RepID=L1K110_GUITC|nr:hypothetical protein GUITHDRAFT_100490 [Guillardia theta CCMP2712]EKX54244.1 hypothetical protein GUITHDRAFT_100490 [Guillardia theta CCMP2712]|eukprot:XP_005841224.1 hypothetical protein GUITHDRAFT_100490 [Guillardia theta CCMP2712]